MIPHSGFHEQSFSDSGIHELNVSDSGFHEQNFSDSGFHEQSVFDSGIYEQNFSDSGFHEQNFSDSGIHEQSVLDSGIYEQNFSDSEFHEQNFSDSGFHEQSFSESGIRILLHEAICSLGYTKGLETAESVEPADATQQGYSPSPQMTAHVDLLHFSPNGVYTHDIPPGVYCRLRNGVIGSCVESSTEKVDLRLPLCL